MLARPADVATRNLAKGGNKDQRPGDRNAGQGGGGCMNVRGNQIKQLRIARGWTQQQLADIANLSLRTIQRVENQGIASNESVSSLAAVMELSREQILSPIENPELRRQAGRQAVWMLLAAVVVGILLGAGGTLLLMR